jgi:hypothetical protein
MEFGTGCKADNGQLERLDAVAKCAAAPVSGDMPVEVVPPLPINNQFHFNSCCGNAVDKAMEFDHWIETGCVVNLSARFAYLSAKSVEGSLSHDDGAQIGSAGIASQQFGHCLEKTFPYWGQSDGYSIGIPEAANREAAQHKLQSVVEPTSIDECLDLIGSGQCGLWFGINWGNTLSNLSIGPDAVLTSKNVLREGGGGHAQCLCGYKTIGGQRVPMIWNSWGESWNNGGTWLCDPDLLWRLIQSAPFGIRGGSKLPAFQTRKFKSREGVYS